MYNLINYTYVYRPRIYDKTLGENKLQNDFIYAYLLTFI